MRQFWARFAPWIAAFAVLWMLAAPIVGFWIIHDTQKAGQAQVHQLEKAFQCVGKSENGLLRDVPLAFEGDKNAADYSKIAKMCKVPEPSAGS